MVAVQTTVGASPALSSAGTGSSLGAWSSAARTYASLSDRLANIEAGHTADTHTQYVRFGGTETITGQKTFTSGNTFFGDGSAATSGNLFLSSGTTGGQALVQFREGTAPRWQLYRPQGDANFYLRDMVNARSQATFSPGTSDATANTTLGSSLTVNGGASVVGALSVAGTTTLGTTTLGATTLTGGLTLAAGTGVVPSTSAVGDAAAGGSSTAVARADHVHGRESFGAVGRIQTVVAGGATGAGSDLTPARSDHAHALGASVNPTASAVGDAVALGASSSVARADHTHGRESFALAITQDSIGAASVGVATTVPRGDHSHGMTGGSPVASAVGDAAADGTATTVARSDHRHAREGFGAAPPNVTVTASATGGAATVARSDHSHSVTVGSPTAMTTFGLVAADGTSVAVARADHNHGTPPAPTAASVGAVALTGGTMTGALTTVSPLTIGTAVLTTTGTAVSFNGAVSSASFSSAGAILSTAGVYDGPSATAANRVYSAANPPPTTAPVVIMPFYVGGSLGTGLRLPQFIATVPMTIRGARSIAAAGSGTYSIWVNGANISGASGAFGTAQALYTFTSYNINAGDRVQLSIDSASSASDLSVTVDTVTR